MTIEIAGVKVRIEGTIDEAEIGVIATMLAEAVEAHGPCILTTRCNPSGEIAIGGDGVVRILLAEA